MATEVPGPEERLAELLESAPPEVRREITAWLLRQARLAAPGAGVPWLLPPPAGAAPSPGGAAQRIRRVAESLPAGMDSQVVTLRLPATRHAALRAWCADHGFSMAAVVRGLVERFLEEQTA
jgi:hypothetical protein